MLNNRRLIFLAGIFMLGFQVEVRAQVSHQFLTSPEALAMGNAYVAVTEDIYSLFYNPSGLARNQHWAFYPFHGGMGITSGFSTAINAVTGNSSTRDRLSALAGKKVFVEGYWLPYFQIPYFAGGALLRGRAQNYIRNPVYNTMDSQIFLEWALVGGFAFPVVPGLVDFGASIKYVSRYKAIVFDNIGADEFVSIVLGNSTSAITRSGSGYSANVGLSLKIPTGIKSFKPVLGLGWEDIGTLTFRNGSNSAPQRIESSLNAGVALNYDLSYLGDLTVAVDVRRLLETNIEYAQKLNFGLRWRVAGMGFFGGVSGGWISGGFTLNLKFLKLSFLTYEEELGNYAGARGDRRYMLQGSMGFDFEGFKFGKIVKRPK